MYNNCFLSEPNSVYTDRGHGRRQRRWVIRPAGHRRSAGQRNAHGQQWPRRQQYGRLHRQWQH